MGTQDSNRGQPTLHETQDRNLLSEEDGAVYVEYISITILVGILAAAALILVGVPLLQNFQNTQLFLISPLP